MSCISKTLSPCRIAIALASGLLAIGAASAATIVIPATDSGWYDDGGSHQQGNENYLVGWRGAEYRNFFVFDLTAIPLGETVVSATLRLWNPIEDPPTQLYNGYESVDPAETYQVLEVTTPAALLILGGSLQTLTYQDLADGTIFGTRELSAADNGTNVDIPLNAAAVSALDSAVGLFALGGHLTTIRPDPFELETAFGGTSETSLRQLVMETVPEPASGALVSLGLAALAARRRRSRRIELR